MYDRCVVLDDLILRAIPHGIAQFFWSQPTLTKKAQVHAFAKLAGHHGEMPTVILALRESFDLEDWKKNLTFSAEIMNMEGRVHKGFYERSKTIPLSVLAEILKNGNRLILTGFSQGSAVAEVLFVRLVQSPLFNPSWINRILFMGFGSPPVGIHLHNHRFQSEQFIRRRRFL